MNSEKIILFDGVCNLCNSTVQKVIENDAKNQFKFASLQSEFGQKFLENNHLSKDEFNSMILVDGEKFYTRSDAALRIGKELKGLYKLSGLLFAFPKFIRNSVYDFVSRNRYKWFGKQESCWLPTPELKEKFIQ
ncbi:thiol-disulfide oxidoreductase DCC family protein [Moheibacter lacus]|uniref:Thiol-disulfide oxidoreductase DCC family protein n=1 Tax=Moheibacter lacus TaxID=2745851 RepID=A0A838ZU40_9FLAO|nr:thiol-disulfide oxidoreductase DCC family protein [Moheibacter lacus]MBA5630473.1 thiol-disulfide oxidoreductase DCC family protein [Moheibacter lacus]